MYDASTWHEVRTLSELTAADAEAHPDGVRLTVDASTPAPDLTSLPDSVHLGRVAVLELDGDVRAVADAILRSPHLSGVHTIVLRDVWWGDYWPDVAPYGWEEHALSEALDALFERAPFERLVCRGSLPSYSDGEYGGSLGFVMIASWWMGLRGLELDTPELHDDFLRRIHQFPNLLSLRVASPLLTDASTQILSRMGSCFDGMEEFECEGYLISTMGWEWIYDASWLPDHLSDHFDALACAPPKTWEERFGDVRSLTQEPMGVDVFHVVVDQLGKLRDEDSARYLAEILPHLESLDRGTWPDRIEVVFGGRGDIATMTNLMSVAPFLRLDVCTADPSWSNGKWEYLYEGDVLGSIRRIEAFNHNLSIQDGHALRDAQALSGLEEISFSTQHAFPIEALSSWLSASYLGNLELLELTLERSMPGAEVLRTLCASEHLGALRTLKLDVYEVDAAIGVLAQSPLLSRLEALEIARLSAKGRAILLASPHLSDSVRARLG